MGKLANPAVGRQLKMVADKIRSLNETGEAQYLSLFGYRAKITKYDGNHGPGEYGVLCSKDGRYYFAYLSPDSLCGDKNYAYLLKRNCQEFVSRPDRMMRFKIYAYAEIYNGKR
jgi:hypothetical protein